MGFSSVLGARSRFTIEGLAKVLIWPGSIICSKPLESSSYSRGTGGVERNRDSRLLIALYSWSMAASKPILLFHRETLPAILFSRFNETSSSTALNFASEFSFSRSFDPRKSVQLNDYLSGGDGSRWIGSRFI